MEEKTEDFFDETKALAEMLNDEVLFCNGRYFSSHKDSKSEGETIVLFVLCNDIFAWGCADAEDLPLNELENLYKMWQKDKRWGAAKWCCKRRNEKPQNPVIDYMKKDGSWEGWMDNLQDNYYDKMWREKHTKEQEQKIKDTNGSS